MWNLEKKMVQKNYFGAGIETQTKRMGMRTEWGAGRRGGTGSGTAMCENQQLVGSCC